MEHLLVEIVDDNGQPSPPGEEGQVAITDLHNYGMPFVGILMVTGQLRDSQPADVVEVYRYCGKVVGRQLDILTTPPATNPRRILPHLIKDFTPVRRFQVVQSHRNQITLKLVVDKTLGPLPGASGWHKKFTSNSTRPSNSHFRE